MLWWPRVKRSIGHDRKSRIGPLTPNPGGTDPPEKPALSLSKGWGGGRFGPLTPNPGGTDSPQKPALSLSKGWGAGGAGAGCGDATPLAVLRALRGSVAPGAHEETLMRWLRNRYFLATDVLLLPLAGYFCYVLRPRGPSTGRSTASASCSWWAWPVSSCQSSSVGRASIFTLLALCLGERDVAAGWLSHSRRAADRCDQPGRRATAPQQASPDRARSPSRSCCWPWSPPPVRALAVRLLARAVNFAGTIQRQGARCGNHRPSSSWARATPAP